MSTITKQLAAALWHIQHTATALPDAQQIARDAIAAYRALPAAPAQAPAAERQPIETIDFWANAYTNPGGDPHFMGHGMVAKLLREYAEFRRAALAATPAPQAVPADAQWVLHMAQEELKHHDPWPPVGAQAVAVAAASSAPAEPTGPKCAVLGRCPDPRKCEIEGACVALPADWRAAPPAAQPAEPQRVQLTEEQIIYATDEIDMDVPGCFIRIARAIERAHGIPAPTGSAAPEAG